MLFPSTTDRDALALADATRQRSFHDLEVRVAGMARFFDQELRLSSNDHVATLVGNRVEAIELTLGALAAGVWLTPINWHLTSDEIAYIVADSGARVLFTDGPHAALARVAASRGSPAPLVIEVGDELDGAISNVASTLLDLGGTAGGTMIYTSGTTGRPKGVKRARPPTLGAAIERMREAGRGYGLDGGGAHLVTGPLYHAAPALFALYDLLNGAPVHLMERWSAEATLESFTRDRIRHTHLVPTMLVRLLKLPDATRADFKPRELDLVLHGAAPISPEVKRRMIAWWGPILVEYWGATEGGVTTLATSADWLERPGTVGRPIPSFEVYAGDDSHRRLRAGEVGLLHSRHRTLERVFEYHHDPDKTAAIHPEPHVFTTGDVGYVDADGYVFLTDRTAHLIISGGVNIYPAEIEHVLIEHPAVLDVGVFGIPDEDWGESVKAAIELAPGFQASPELAAEILDFATTKLARYKIPRSIDFEPTLPRMPNGKLYLKQLRDRYWEGRTRKI